MASRDFYRAAQNHDPPGIPCQCTHQASIKHQTLPRASVFSIYWSHEALATAQSWFRSRRTQRRSRHHHCHSLLPSAHRKHLAEVRGAYAKPLGFSFCKFELWFTQLGSPMCSGSSSSAPHLDARPPRALSAAKKRWGEFVFTCYFSRWFSFNLWRLETVVRWTLARFLTSAMVLCHGKLIVGRLPLPGSS